MRQNSALVEMGAISGDQRRGEHAAARSLINGSASGVAALIMRSASSSDSRATVKSGVMPAKYPKVGGAIPLSRASRAAIRYILNDRPRKRNSQVAWRADEAEGFLRWD